MTDPAMWAKLAADDFPMTEPAVDLTTSVRRETTLNAAQAGIAVDEYRRFLYLRAVHGARVLPSHVLQAIRRVHAADRAAYAQMWHNVISGEMAACDAGYAPRASDAVDAATLALYLAEFGTIPNPKIWPDARLRRWVQVMGWAVAAGFVVAVIGITQSNNIMIAMGSLVAFGAFLWSITYGPWSVSKRTEGSGDGVILTGDGGGRGDGGKASADSGGSDGAGGGDGGGGGGD